MALVDPVTACGLLRPEGVEEKPKLLSPRFVRLFDTNRYADQRRSKMTMHSCIFWPPTRPATMTILRLRQDRKHLAERYAHLNTVRDFDRLKGGRRHGGSD